ncbi:MAG: DNA adenine methylase [Oenococcus oeni]
MPATKTILRYPGGKTQLYTFVQNILSLNSIKGRYVEPFAGGAGIAIELLLTGSISTITINDLDKSIFAVWNAVIFHPESIIEKIKSVPFCYGKKNTLSSENLISFWNKQKNIHENNKNDKYSLENAFSTLMLNRMNISGIISGGPIGGRKQLGKYKIDSRFNKRTLIHKVELISSKKNSIDLYNYDANELILKIKNEKKYEKDNTLIFFDPPYYQQGKNLYLSFINKNQHKNLAKNILSMNDYHWITTYDEAEQISDLYNSGQNQRYSYPLNYSANKRGTVNEFLFASQKTKLPLMDKFPLTEV